jgi:hypothetical protein
LHVTPALLLLLLQFGVYHLALHHATVDAVDAVEGSTVDDPALINYLIQVRSSSSSRQGAGYGGMAGLENADQHHQAGHRRRSSSSRRTSSARKDAV